MRDAGSHVSSTGPLTEVNQQDIGVQASRALFLQRPIGAALDRRIQLGINALDLERPEYQILRRNILFQGSISRAATPANFNYVNLGTVAGVICVVTEVTVTNENAGRQVVFIGLATANANMTNGSASVCDGRALGITKAASFFSGTAVAPTYPTGWVVTIPALSSSTFAVRYVLATNPGTTLQVVDATANQSLQVGFKWSERAILPSEA